MIFLFLAILIIFYVFFKIYIQKKVLKNTKSISFNKNSLNQWMNLSKKERYKLSKKDSVSYLNKRKVLLEQIRKEYRIISKGGGNKLDN